MGTHYLRRNLLVPLSGLPAALLAVVVLAASSALLGPATTYAAARHFAPPPVSTISGLHRVEVVGSTAFIVDGRGRTIHVDANPYGLAMAPRVESTLHLAPGALKAGDIVVSNIGANETGTTLVRFPGGKGPGLLFNTDPNQGTRGTAFQAFNTHTGRDWVANVSANYVQVFAPDGTVYLTIISPLFNKPWGMAYNGGGRNPRDGSVGSFFVSNAADATIDRVDIVPDGKGTTFGIFQIGQLPRMKGGKTKISMVWMPSLKVGGHLYTDVLIALDPANNRVAAYPNSTTRNTSPQRATDQGLTVFKGAPLNDPGGSSINPLNGDLLVANLRDNNLVELNLARGRAIGVRLLDNVPVDRQTGNGSALFGVLATKDQRGNLEVYFTDDNTNTLDVLRA
jgi:hypothetical protein